MVEDAFICLLSGRLCVDVMNKVFAHPSGGLGRLTTVDGMSWVISALLN